MSLLQPVLLSCVLLVTARAAVPGRAPANQLDEPPRTFLYDRATLAAAKSRLASGDRALVPALDRLRSEAAALLSARPTSVMDKTLTAASGDKHDYFSFGPYWWPDPAKPNGLPYIRRDGDINPASKVGTDDEPFGTLCGNVETLCLAYWFTGDERFARKAAQLVRVWFLDPATRMNPNFQHAQAIPGITDGRGIGIIEARELPNVNDGLALLSGSPAWTKADRAALAAWLVQFYEWLKTSKNGRDESNAENNHGTWYDLQVAHLALVLGRDSDARQVLASGQTRRIARQIEPNGAQPHELARTKSLNYSLFNLEALFGCARLAEQVDLDWWSFQTADGRNLGAAFTYLAPYVDPALPWPKKDLHEGDRRRLLPLFDEYLRHARNADVAALAAKFVDRAAPDARWRLIRNRPAGGAQ